MLEAAVNGRADALVTCNLRHFAQGAARSRLRLARPEAWAALPSIEGALRVVQIMRLAPRSKGASQPVSGRSPPLAATPAHALLRTLSNRAGTRMEEPVWEGMARTLRVRNE